MNILNTVKIIFSAFLLSVLVSCGSSSTSGSGTGRVSLLVTDGPTTDFDRINVTLESISFLCEGDDDGEEVVESLDGDDDSDNDCHEVVLFEETRVINLLALQNYSDLLSTTEVAAREYSKIRMYVSRVALERLDADGEVIWTEDAKLPANGKIDLNPRGTFEVIDGESLVVELDMDANKSIHIVETGSGKYIFRPVIFVNILGAEELKLVIVDGRVFDKTASDFQLCEVEVLAADESCTTVLIVEDTVVQDDLIGLAIADDIDNNDIVTALGQMGSEGVTALHIVIAAAAEEDQNLAMFTGAATSIVEADAFDMETDDDNDVVPPETVLGVELAASTRIFDKHGTVMSSDNIVAGSDVDVFGLALPELDTVDTVRAAFVIYDNDVEAEAVSGTITAINLDDSQLTITVVDALIMGEVFSGDVCVDVDDADLFLLEVAGGGISSEEIAIDDLEIGMSVDVYADNDDSGCLSADVVLVTLTL